MAFRQVSPRPDFVENEKKQLAWWYDAGIVEKYLRRNDDAAKKFRFLDGPITANNPMGVHHAHGRTIKDFFQRYKNMQGFRQRFQNGFDAQGLWVEVEVEKELGFNSKCDIEEYGLEKFSQANRERVEKFSKIQTQQSKRLGMFMDWGNDYYTMSDRNNEHIWYFLKKCHQEKLLYKGHDVMPWCVRCGTAISQHELSDGGYQTVQHASVYVKFALREKEDKYLLVWTTTPWTLPANTAVAVKPDANYVEVKVDGENLILAKERVSSLLPSKDLRILKHLNGQELVGLEYQPPYNFSTGNQNAFTVLTANFVGTSDGTGIVHIAPGAGKEDFELGRERDLPVIAPLDEFGIYLDGFGSFSGKNVWQVNQEVIEDLTARGKLFRTEEITHTYPHCWRCREELVFRLTDEWFIDMDPYREKFKEAAKQANWMPRFAGKRMENWLDTMGDWPISRRRYWGLALPIWQSEDGEEFHVVGTKDELRELALEPEKVNKLPELHRPWIDEIKIRSPQTGKILTRIPAVGDAWLDAGIVPFSTLNYLTDREHWEEWYPFELISEYIAQVRLWFYSTLVMSVVLEDRAPWENVLASGFIVDEKGEAMHKSAGNAIDFDEAVGRAGADTMRWLYLREGSANYHGAGNMRFGFQLLDDVRRRFFMILWNSYRFFVNNANLDDWQPPEDYEQLGRSSKLFVAEDTTVLDRWLMSRLNNLVRFATKKLDNFNSPDVANAIQEFVVNDFSQWYIRRSRDRVGPTAKDSPDKESFYMTAYHTLLTLTKLLAPFIPFLAEEIYQNLKTTEMPESVHLTDWPSWEEERIDAELEKQMDLTREIVEKGHAARKEAGIKVRQPLAKLVVSNLPLPAKKLKLLKKLIKQELNVRKVTARQGKGSLQVSLDTQITANLKREGYMREILRAVQGLRRKGGYDFDDEIIVYYSGDAELTSVVEEFATELKQKLLAKRLEPVADPANLPSEASAKEGAKLILNEATLHLATQKA